MFRLESAQTTLGLDTAEEMGAFLAETQELHKPLDGTLIWGFAKGFADPDLGEVGEGLGKK